MGTAEIYRVVEEIPEVRDNMGIDLEFLGRAPFVPLFVVLQPGVVLVKAMQERIKHQIRSKALARHVYNEVMRVAEMARTLRGEKMEVPARKLLLAASPGKAASPDSMSNPDSLAFFVPYAKAMAATNSSTSQTVAGVYASPATLNQVDSYVRTTAARISRTSCCRSWA